MSTDVETVADTSPAPESALSTEAPAQVAADAAPSEGDIRAEQRAALDAVRARESGAPDVKAERQRGPDGKFAKAEDKAETKGEEPAPEVAPKDAKPEADKVDAKPEEKPAPVVEAPAHLPPAVREEWGKLTESGRAAVDKVYRENAALAGKLANAQRDWIKPFADVAAKHDDFFRSHNVHPTQVLEHFIGWDKAISKDPATAGAKMLAAYGMTQPEAVALINNLVRDYKIDASAMPANLLDPATGQPLDPSQMLAMQASSDGLRRQVEAKDQEIQYLKGVLKDRHEAEERARAEYAQDREKAALTQHIDAFRATVTTEEWDVLRPYVIAEIDGLPDDVPVEQIIPRAAEAARKRLDGFVSARVSAAEKARAEQAQKAASAAKKAGSINIEGRAQPVTPEMSVRDSQRAALAAMRARNGAAT